MNDYALDFIARHKSKPFFLYYPMMLTHSPYEPTPDSKDWNPNATGKGKGKGKAGNKAANKAAKHDPAHFGDMVRYMDKLIGKVVAKLDEQGLRDNTLLLFLGDNGTGSGTRSMMGDRVVSGGKGRTVDAGMRVPFIASWPGRIGKGIVCRDLVDTTDFVPTICEAAAVKPADPEKLDGRSFFPQLCGEKGKPRPWIYSWYSPRQGRNKEVKEFAMDHRFKLYRGGRFYDIVKDPDETSPLDESALDGDAAKAAQTLKLALDQFKEARPAHLRP